MLQSISLRLRLTLAVGLLCGAMALLFVLLVELLLQARLLGAVDARLRTQAAQFAGVVAAADPVQPGASQAEFDLLDGYAALIDPDGTIQARSRALPDGNVVLDPQVLRSAQRGQAVVTTMADAQGVQWRVLISPVAAGTQPGRVVLVAVSLAAHQGVLADVRWLLLGCAVLVVVVALGAAALLTGRILAPMTQLMHDAAAVASSGQYDRRIPVVGRNDEVGQFAQTINTLIATIERTLRQQRDFLADTSHELRSPLTVVLANLNLLRRDLEPHERELSVDEAASEAQRMRRLINELLLLAQSDAAQVIAQAPVRLEHLVKTVVRAARRQAPDHVYQLQVAEPLIVIGDEERLTQLLQNLLENAAKYTPSGTNVEVSLRRSGSMAQLVVADRGPGIAAEHLAHLWDRYYRVDKLRSRESGSTGLGLPIVKYIAEAHGGHVDVTSDEGAGTTFTIELPLAPGPIERANQPLEIARV